MSPNRVGLVAVFALMLAPIGPAAPPLAAPLAPARASAPSLLWEMPVEGVGADASAPRIAIAGARVLVAGVPNEYTSPDPRAWIHGYDRGTGELVWQRRIDDPGTHRLTAPVPGRLGVYVVGSASTFEVGQSHSESFVLALRTGDGNSRWEARSMTDPGAFGESIGAAATGGGLLVIAGSTDSRILVRALRERTGKTAWEDSSPPPEDSAIDERITTLLVDGDRVYAAGSRHTVGGRSSPYVVRAYDLATGERLWESQFGQQLTFTSGLALVDGALVLAGHYWDIGPGITRMEAWGLDPDSGAFLWMRRPGGRTRDGSSAADVIAVDDRAIVVGAASRRRTLPVLRAYTADGGAPWTADFDAWRYGVVNAAVEYRGAAVTAGVATERVSSGRRYWLRGQSPADGSVLWEEMLLLGPGDSAAHALASDGSRLVVLGSATPESGEPQWLLRLYR